MAPPTALDFAALARSSPWLWSTLRLTVRWPGDPRRGQPLRAWLRRPDRLRVETVGGEPVQIVHESPGTVAILTPSGAARTAAAPWWTDPRAPRPSLRPDGLVAARPDGDGAGFAIDAPMYRDYFWVAMLDPVELADGCDPDTGAAGAGTAIDSVSEVWHGGRPAWQAMVRPLPAYQPRCTCCSLLRSRDVDIAEAASGAGEGVVLPEYPRGYRVRLDRGTGVCVLTEPIGSSAAGRGHEVWIEAVDEPMGDEMFRR